jgi:hypothetical protein
VSGSFQTDGRIAELLAERAVEGLDQESQGVLAQLLSQEGLEDDDGFDRVAAALALNQLRPEPLPEPVRERIEQDAGIWFAALRQPNVRPLRAPAPPAEPATGPGLSSTAGWWAAAAGVALAAIGLWRAEGAARESRLLNAELATARSEAAQLAEAVTERDARIASLQAGPAEPSPGDLRLRLLEDSGTGLWAWRATEDPVAGGASGDIVWNSERQSGFMRFVGLQPNAPDTASYQLWIFDEARDERFPVDGGVFNVPSGAGEIIVPIRPTLDVSRPVLFAVTVERPGGVMVSSRERIALVAEPGA